MMEPVQVEFVLDEQEKNLPSVEEYFLERNIATPGEMELIRERLDRHNRAASLRKSA